jgi:hypothetical protein
MSTNAPTVADNTAAPLQIGEPVFTLDNKRLGKVKEVNETHFKVDARFRKDYWLARDRIAYVDADCVGMSWRSDEAELYKLGDPAHDGYARDLRSVEGRDKDIKEGLGSDMNYRGRFGI